MHALDLLVEQSHVQSQRKVCADPLQEVAVDRGEDVLAGARQVEHAEEHLAAEQRDAGAGFVSVARQVTVTRVATRAAVMCVETCAAVMCVETWSAVDDGVAPASQTTTRSSRTVESAARCAGVAA